MANKPATASTTPPIDEVEASRAPLMDHLVELRTRLMRIFIAVGLLFLFAWFIADDGLKILLSPLHDAAIRAGRPPDQPFEAITNAPLEMVFVKLKLCFVIALAVGFPYVAYQIYGFVAPGLYKNERSAVMPFLFVMPVLFAAGGAMVYFYVLPVFMDLSFSQELQGNNVKVVYLPKVKEYYDLSISLLTCFGFAFQLPIVLSLLARAGVVSASSLRKGRKFAFCAIVIVAMIMTPPDPFSWLLLSVPLAILYESGIWSAAGIEAGRKRREAAEAKREEEEARREAAEEAKRRAAAAVAAPPVGTLPAGE
ncbi:MAG: twin-arginine translocase subunit TatC [Hyphomonadaceae bacterium]